MSKPFRRTLGCLTVLVVLIILGIVFPIQLIFILALGWTYFLWITIPKIQIDPAASLFALVCLTIFAAGTHAFLRWLVSNMKPTTEPQTPQIWKIRWSAALVAVTLLLFVSGMAATGMAHQIGWLIRSPEPLIESGNTWNANAARRAQSMNNLKQIGLGLLNYESSAGHLPPGATFDAHGVPLHSWQTQILEFMEQTTLYRRIAQDQPWNAPVNRDVFRTQVWAYRNPGILEHDGISEYAPSDYSANGLVIGGNRRMKLDEITDGASNTIMTGEVVSKTKPWGDPTNWRDVSLGINASPDGFGGPWKDGGAVFGMADGSVRFIKKTIDPRVLKSLSTPSGGEKIPPNSY